eukprot:2890844-Amphidinium_carterae.1
MVGKLLSEVVDAVITPLKFGFPGSSAYDDVVGGALASEALLAATTQSDSESQNYLTVTPCE